MDKLGPSNPSAKPGPGLMRNSMIFGIFSPNQDVQVDRKMDYVKKGSGIGKVIVGQGNEVSKQETSIFDSKIGGMTEPTSSDGNMEIANSDSHDDIMVGISVGNSEQEVNASGSSVDGTSRTPSTVKNLDTGHLVRVVPEKQESESSDVSSLDAASGERWKIGSKMNLRLDLNRRHLGVLMYGTYTPPDHEYELVLFTTTESHV